MKILKSEKGNTLVITILVLVIASVIGLTLMSMSMNGTKRNEHRENVTQATRHAESGINHIALLIEKEIYEELEKSYTPNIGNYDPLMEKNFVKFFNGVVEDYLCSKPGNKLVTNGNKYEVCIDDSSYNNSKSDTLKELTFISKGFADGKEKELISTIKIGAKYSEEPDLLNYAVATHTEGNLFLNGGVDIKGNVRTDGNIVITDSSYVSSNSYPWVKNVFPSINDANLDPNKEAVFLVNRNKKLFVNEHVIPNANKQTFIESEKDFKLRLQALDILIPINIELALPNPNKTSYTAISYPELASFDFNSYNSYYNKKLEDAKKNNMNLEQFNEDMLFIPNQVYDVNNFLSDGNPNVYNSLPMKRVNVQEFVQKGNSTIDSITGSNGKSHTFLYKTNDSLNGNYKFNKSVLAIYKGNNTLWI